MDIDVPVRQSEGVRRRIAQHEELVLDVIVRGLRPDLVTDAPHELERFGLHVEQRLRVEPTLEVRRLLDQPPLVFVDRYGLVYSARQRGRDASETRKPWERSSHEGQSVSFRRGAKSYSELAAIAAAQ